MRYVWATVLSLASLLAGRPGFCASAAGAASTSASAEKPRVTFGGFAFSGGAASSELRYPVLTRLNELTDDGTPYLSRLTRIAVEKVPNFAHIELSNDLIRRADEPLVLALAATSELVQQERLPTGQKLVAVLGFDLVLLNFDTLEIVSSQPFLLEYVHVGRGAQQAFSHEEIAKLLKSPLLDATDSSLRRELASRLPSVRVSARNRANLRVNPVVVADAAVADLPPAFRGEVPVYAELVGQIFTAMLAKFGEVTVLPHTKDQLNASMALSFADGSMVQFRIPEPSYAANLRVRGFRKVPFDQTAAEVGWVFGASLDISVEIASDEAALRQTLFSREAVKGIIKTKVPASQKEIDAALPYFEALIDGMGMAIDEMKKNKEARDGFLRLCKT